MCTIVSSYTQTKLSISLCSRVNGNGPEDWLRSAKYDVVGGGRPFKALPRPSPLTPSFSPNLASVYHGLLAFLFITRAVAGLICSEPKQFILIIYIQIQKFVSRFLVRQLFSDVLCVPVSYLYRYYCNFIPKVLQYTT